MISSTHQVKAAYRLFDNESVTHPAVVQTHCAWVRASLDEPGVTLLIEDSTAISYPNLKQARGLGSIGDDYTRGFWLHTTLVVRWEPSDKPGCSERCWPIGLAHQQAWARSEKRPARRKGHGRGKESNHARQQRGDRESTRWASVLGELPARKNPDATLIYLADRESDIYEVFGKCRDAGVSFVIRASHPRALAEQESACDLMSAAENAPVRGQLQLDLPQHNRTATLEVRSATLELRGPPRPGGRADNLTLNIVRVREMNPPAGTDPLEWTLLTDQPVDTLQACDRVVRIYRTRWMIEELHKGMKTGLGLERSQLGDYRKLSALAGVISVTAVRLLQMKWEARSEGEKPLDAKQQKEPMVKLLMKLHPPKGTPTLRWRSISIAKLGGFQGRKSDGPPGWLTLWRGWQTLQLLVKGYQLAVT